jgi:hypothetical protein
MPEMPATVDGKAPLPAGLNGNAPLAETDREGIVTTLSLVPSSVG